MIHPDTDLTARFAADLRAAEFTASALRTLWGEAADDALARGTRVPAIRALQGRTEPRAVIARLLALGLPAEAALIDAALPSLGSTGLERLAVVRRAEETVHPLVLVRPRPYVDDSGIGEWWVASDLDEVALGGPLPDDHVLGVGGASLTLAGLQLPTPAATVLDLGTGCGVQALRARRYAGHVVATDISERALAFARFNSLLNGDGEIEVRLGSLFEPVAGETFDRIVSNPPFVITPRRDDVPAYEYRDGGMQGDDLMAAVVAGVGEHLTEGGTAQFLGNWEYRWGEDGLDRVRAWVEASSVPLDAWIIERERLDPAEYAAMWVRDGGTVSGTAAFERLLDAWLDDFSHRRVTRIGFGYVLLRRSTGAPTITRYERVDTPISAEGSLGSHIAQALDTMDRLASLSDDALAALTVVVAPDVSEARHHMPGEEQPTVIELRQGTGFGRSLSVDTALAALVGACDGDLPLGVLADAIADLLEVEASLLRADLLPRVRELLVTGFLRFQDGAE